ncbi:molybdenum cofactor biosynthesis protein [Thermoplasmatales archaeon ex4484_30]|nr:MAG: molybdenum cofactor biosynthesis protein [Thermoplasmatales archaeon ex4484_30]
MSAMKPFKNLIDFEKAKKIIMENTKEMERKERINILDAEGRVLAASIKAGIDVPGFRRAAMDGYAVIAEDTFGASRINPKRLRLIGKVFAGKRADVRVKKGTCIQISTGAPMPEGADAVVIVEETSKEGNNVNIYKPVYPDANVSAPDSDIRQGDEILAECTILTPPKIGVLAALGLDEVEVYSRPKVKIYPTGDEIVPPGKGLEYGKIYDINSYTLATLLKSMGADVYVNDITGDTKEELESCIDEAMDSDYAIFSGGSSVGERDLLAEIIAKKGELLFHGIAVKPGKPTIFGLVDSTMVFGMPGYPTSCLTNAYVLLVPSIRKMARLPLNVKREEVVLSHDIVSTVGRYQIYTVRVAEGVAYPAFKESGAITSMSMASGYIEIPANTEFIEKGSKVVVNYF